MTEVERRRLYRFLDDINSGRASDSAAHNTMRISISVPLDSRLFLFIFVRTVSLFITNLLVPSAFDPGGKQNRFFLQFVVRDVPDLIAADLPGDLALAEYDNAVCQAQHFGKI